MLRRLRETTDRRGELLEAAVRVFARKGFHGSRVGDIAEEAGVAHGLLYHYFRSKDEVLETIFRDAWERLATETDRIEASDIALREQLRRFARIYLGSWLVTPERIAVLGRQIARSPAVGSQLGGGGGGFLSPMRLIQGARARGEG